MQDRIKTFSSIGMLVILVALMMYLTFIEVPAGNKDIIVTILGVLLGAGAAAVPNLFGDSDAEKDKLKKRVQALEIQNKVLTEQLTEIRKMLIERHVVKGEGIS